jgi:hypothetical protein
LAAAGETAQLAAEDPTDLLRTPRPTEAFDQPDPRGLVERLLVGRTVDASIELLKHVVEQLGIGPGVVLGGRGLETPDKGPEFLPAGLEVAMGKMGECRGLPGRVIPQTT